MTSKDEVVRSFEQELRTLAWPGETIDPRPLVTRRSWNAGEGNSVTAYALDESNADAAIQEELRHFRQTGRTFEWKVYSFDEPSDLVERLRAAGFSVGDREAVLVYDLARGLEPLRVHSTCEVRRVEDEKALEDFRVVSEAAFGRADAATIEALREGIRCGEFGHAAYVGYVEGVPASVGRLYSDRESAFAGLYGGGTRPGFRSMGCYQAVVVARARAAKALGARYLQIDALPTSAPILRDMGFEQIADTWPCEPPS